VDKTTIGDLENDIPMFRKDGFSIAMRNADPESKILASGLSLSKRTDGLSAGVDELILPRARNCAGPG